MTEAVAAALDIQATRVYIDTLRPRLPMFVVTEKPTDWPDFYVARLWLSLPQPQHLPLVIMDRSLDRLQVTLEALGMVHISPDPNDDPSILETWI